MIKGTTCAIWCVHGGTWRSENNTVESVLFFQFYIGSWVVAQFARLTQQTSLSTEPSPQMSFISPQFPLIFFNSYFHS